MVMKTYEFTKLDYHEGGWVEKGVILDALDMPGVNESGEFPSGFDDRLEEINDSLRAIKDPVTGNEFEIAITNPGLSSQGTALEVGTYSSSISGNPGNAAELAMRSLFANKTRVYLAPFGNGLSSPLSTEELSTFARTGQLMFGPNSTVRALSRALGTMQTEESLEINYISTDSFGSYIANGLMSVMDQNQVGHVFMKGRPGVSDFSMPRMLWRMLIRENLSNAYKYKFGDKSDPWQITPEMMAHVKALAPKIYAEESKVFVRQGSKEQLKAYGNGVRITEADGVSVNDAFAHVMKRQTQAQFGFDMPKKDLLYKNKDDVARFVGQILDIAHAQSVDKEPVFYRSSGNHGAHAFQIGRAHV